MIPQIQLDVDERIQRDPELKRVVELATDYLVEHAEKPIPAAIRWKLFRSEDAVELSLSDETDDDRYPVNRRFPLRYLFDDVSRDVSVLWALVDYYGMRSVKSGKRVDKLLQRLREEEANDEEDAE